MSTAPAASKGDAILQADMSVAVSNIQSDNFDGGGQTAKKLAELIGGKGKVVALTNSPAAAVAQQRLQGFQEEVAKRPDITFLGPQDNNQMAKATAILTSNIAAHPDLAGIFTIATNNTEGAATDMREAQRENKIMIVGFDTSNPTAEAIHKGIVAADIVQHPYRVGQFGVEMAIAALDSKPVERQVHTPSAVATPANIDTPEVQQHIYRTSCR